MSKTQELLKLTYDVADKQADNEQWMKRIKDADASQLVELIAPMTSDEEKRAATIKALREAIISEVERKNTERIVATMEKLDRSATLLTWVSLLVAIIGAILAGMQVWQGFLKSS